jgi:hypothetical protein
MKRYNVEQARIEEAVFTVQPDGTVIVSEEVMTEMLTALGFEVDNGQDFKIRPTYQSQ